MTEIALFLYEDMSALDAVGPYEVLARLPDVEVKFVASTPGPRKTDVGLVLTADSAHEDVPAPDIIVEVNDLRLHGVDAPGAAGVLAGKRAVPHSPPPPIYTAQGGLRQAPGRAA